MNGDKKTKVKRAPKRGHYDSETIYSILDSDSICHVGFVHNGYPVVIPTLYGRKNDSVFIHGATTSRLIQDLEKGIDVSLSVTIVDGLVLARSAFHHSMNYRSVVIFGKAYKVSEDQKNDALYTISEHILKGRWDECREPNSKELKATTVLELKISEASAKIRTGPPKDEVADYQLPLWAGVVPIKKVFGTPISDPDLTEEYPLPQSVATLK